MYWTLFTRAGDRRTSFACQNASSQYTQGVTIRFSRRGAPQHFCFMLHWAHDHSFRIVRSATTHSATRRRSKKCNTRSPAALGCYWKLFLCPEKWEIMHESGELWLRVCCKPAAYILIYWRRQCWLNYEYRSGALLLQAQCSLLVAVLLRPLLVHTHYLSEGSRSGSWSAIFCLPSLLIQHVNQSSAGILYYS